jgi:hypothetical protein
LRDVVPVCSLAPNITDCCYANKVFFDIHSRTECIFSDHSSVGLSLVGGKWASGGYCSGNCFSSLSIHHTCISIFLPSVQRLETGQPKALFPRCPCSNHSRWKLDLPISCHFLLICCFLLAAW